jgi:hypothetical protein
MHKHGFLFGTAALLAGMTLASMGCGSDPNKPSRVFTGGGGSSSTGNGGSNGTDGGGGSMSGAIVGTPVATFDTTDEGFMLDPYPDPNQTNLADPAHGASPTLMFDGANGNPTPGSLVVMAPYSGANQYVLAQKNFGTTNSQNWMGRTLHVRIRATTGTFKGGAQVFVKTGAAFSFGGTYTNFAPNSNNWQEFTLNIGTPVTFGNKNTYDPTQVVEFGVELNTSGAGAGSTPVTFNIDSFSVDPPLPGSGDAGSDTGKAPEAGAGGDAATDLSLD